MTRAIRSIVFVWAVSVSLAGCSGRESAAAAQPPQSAPGANSSTANPSTKDASMVSVRVFNDLG
jgi:hypothetical protein